ncbi:MAG: tRNA pseudouridine(38-40) synthase TruA [Paludibacteraceae bacterium]|nr:tRNA pseudouridine(38-40) synthase TruA [Paludibacteraceae bacterium]
MRYFITLSYNGKNYHGWQIQPNGSSVQETLEKALSTMLRCPISIVGAGRTDAGVHAKKMIAHFDTDVALNTLELPRRLNCFLPTDIAIQKIEPVANDLHARFSATKRSYEYHLVTEKDVFCTETAFFHPGTLDFDAMNQAAAQLFNYIDFTSFSKLHTDVKTNNCTIFEARWKQLSPSHWVFHISADRFLRNMVRAIVGTLLQVGTGKISIDDFKRIIESKDRCQAGTSAPAHGLYLTDVKY